MMTPLRVKNGGDPSRRQLLPSQDLAQTLGIQAHGKLVLDFPVAKDRYLDRYQRCLRHRSKNRSVMIGLPVLNTRRLNAVRGPVSPAGSACWPKGTSVLRSC